MLLQQVGQVIHPHSAVSGLSCSLEQPLYFSVTQLATKCLHASMTESDGEMVPLLECSSSLQQPLGFFIIQLATKYILQARQTVAKENDAASAL